MNSLGTNVAAYDKSVTLREKLKQAGIQRFLDMPGLTDVEINEPGVIFTESSAGRTRHDERSGQSSERQKTLHRAHYHGHPARISGAGRRRRSTAITSRAR